MHSLIVLYTKLSGLSNDRSYYLNLFDHVQTYYMYENENQHCS